MEHEFVAVPDGLFVERYKSAIVYDCFAGSGTTLVAAQQLERIGYGVELDAAYVAVTLERLAALGLKPELVQEIGSGSPAAVQEQDGAKSANGPEGMP